MDAYTILRLCSRVPNPLLEPKLRGGKLRAPSGQRACLKLLLCLPLRGSGVLRRKGPRANVEGSRKARRADDRHGHPAARPDLLVHYCAGLLKYAICHVQRCMCTFRRLRQGQGITASKHECRGRCCFGCGLGLGFLSSLNCFQPAAGGSSQTTLCKAVAWLHPTIGALCGCLQWLHGMLQACQEVLDIVER